MHREGEERVRLARRRTAIRAFIAASNWVAELSPDSCLVQPPASFAEIRDLRRDMCLNVAMRVIGQVAGGSEETTLADRSALVDLEHAPPDHILERALICVMAIARRVRSSTRRISTGEILPWNESVNINLTEEYGESGARQLVRRYESALLKRTAEGDRGSRRERRRPADEPSKPRTEPVGPPTIVDMIQEHRREVEERERRKGNLEPKPGWVGKTVVTVLVVVILALLFGGIALMLFW